MSLRSVLLVLLGNEPNSGYGAGRLLQGELSHVWSARLQQIYGELGKMEEDGLIEAKLTALPNRPAKKVYSVTPAGEEALDSWLARSPLMRPARDELLIQLFCLGRVSTASLAHRLEQRRDDASGASRAWRAIVLVLTGRDSARLGLLLTLEVSIARADAEVAWCEKALLMLRNDAVQRPQVADQPVSHNGVHAAIG
jgi:PadR family transcriptional regulator, regulatory protein AphA